MLFDLCHRCLHLFTLKTTSADEDIVVSFFFNSVPSVMIVPSVLWHVCTQKNCKMELPGPRLPAFQPFISPSHQPKPAKRCALEWLVFCFQRVLGLEQLFVGYFQLDFFSWVTSIGIFSPASYSISLLYWSFNMPLSGVHMFIH